MSPGAWRTLIIIGFFQLALGLGIALCYANMANAEPENRAMRFKQRSILLIGDSITAGAVADGPVWNSWAALLRQEGIRLGYTVNNKGVPGSDSFEWSSDYQWATPLHGYPTIREVDDGSRIVVVALGLNDALAYSTLPKGMSHRPLEYGAAMDSILDDLERRRRRILLVAPSQVSWMPSKLVNAYLTAYRNYCEAAAVGKRIRFVAPELDGGDYVTGNVHPNASGHRKIYEAVLGGLEGWVP